MKNGNKKCSILILILDSSEIFFGLRAAALMLFLCFVVLVLFSPCRLDRAGLAYLLLHAAIWQARPGQDWTCNSVKFLTLT